MSEATEIPAFDLFDVDDAEIAFGCDISRYLGRLEGSKMQSLLRDEAKAVNGLFFKGGSLSEYGFNFRPEIDQRKAYRAIQAMLCSWAPPHEAKVGTVALAIHNWCEPALGTPASEGEE